VAALDPLRIVEAGYSAAGDAREWLEGIVSAAAPFGISTGVAAFSLDMTSADRITSFVARGTDDRIEEQVRAFDGAFDRETAEAIYAPTEFVGNVQYRVRRLSGGRATASEQLPASKRLRAWALLAGDPRARSLGIVFPGPEGDFDPDRPFPHARVLGLAGAHLGAALRLRELGASAADDEETECVLSPEGKVLHATGAATAKRSSLVAAVEQRARARGKLREVDAFEAANLWSALVAGRWTIVDFTDRDGKRMLLARKNPVDAPDILSLTDEERDVCWLATLGHTQKYIGYELGLSMSAVNRQLASGLRKLRLSNRRDLLRKLGR
jgi:DNA-binding CsgD family transcriptional regulator